MLHMKHLPALFSFLLILVLHHASAQGRSLRTDSIYSLEKVQLGGIPQTILTTGTDSSKPVLLILHGGPGYTEMALFRIYNRALDNDYVVVHWDQRGAAASYDPSIPVSSMNIDQFVSDAHELVTLLKQRFKKDKIFLLGHSWGTSLGLLLVQRYPQDFAAYIGVGQIVNMMDNERISLQYTIQMASKTHDTTAIRELSIIAHRYPAKNDTSLNDLYLQRKWLSYFGGAVRGHRDYSYIFSRIKPGDPLYNEEQVEAGEAFSMRTLWKQLLNIDFLTTAPVLKVPVYFLTGRYDYNTPFALVEKYYNQVKAPAKKLIWFENSAHIPQFEEAARFNAVMKEIAHR